MTLFLCLVLTSGAQEQPASMLPWGGDDFIQYYVALELLFEGKNPYDQKLTASRQISYGRSRGVQMYAPPWAILPSLLVIRLPFPLAIYGYLALNVALLIFCAVCWTLLFFPGRVSYIPFAIIAFFLWSPSLIALYCGQNSVWPLAGFTGWLWFTTRNRNTLAGCFLALLIVKPHLGLLCGVFAGVYALRQRNWTTIASFGLAVSAATLGTVCLRTTIWSEYHHAVQTGISHSIFRTPTFNGWALPYLGPTIEYVTYTLLGVVCYCVAVRTWSRFKPESIHLPTLNASTQSAPLIVWSTIVCMMVIPFVPYAWIFDFVFVLPGCVLVIGLFLGRERYGQIGLIIWVVIFMWLILAWWQDDGLWIMPWMGLAATAWLLCSRSGRTLPVGITKP